MKVIKPVILLIISAILLLTVVAKCRPEEIVNIDSTIVKREKYRQMILDSPASLSRLKKYGLQAADLVGDQWTVSPLDEKKLVRIDWDHQRVIYFKDGLPNRIYICSTRCASFGKDPFGVYVIVAMETNHWSKKYKVNMPWAVLFIENRGIYIHGTQMINELGLRRSHGCVRLHPDNAKDLFNRVHNGIIIEFRRKITKK